MPGNDPNKKILRADFIDKFMETCDCKPVTAKSAVRGLLGKAIDATCPGKGELSEAEIGKIKEEFDTNVKKYNDKERKTKPGFNVAISKETFSNAFSQAIAVIQKINNKMKEPEPINFLQQLQTKKLKETQNKNWRDKPDLSNPKQQ